MKCTEHFNCVGAILHIMPSFSPLWTLKPSKISSICPVWCNDQKDVQSAQTAGAFWVRNCSFCYHMSMLLTKGFWHLVLSRMLAQKLKQVGSSQMSHWITLSRDNFEKPHCAVLWRMTYFVLLLLYHIFGVVNINESFAWCTSVYFYADS